MVNGRKSYRVQFGTMHTSDTCASRYSSYHTIHIQNCMYVTASSIECVCVVYTVRCFVVIVGTQLRCIFDCVLGHSGRSEQAWFTVYVCTFIKQRTIANVLNN